MRRLTSLVIGLGLLWPSAALAASPSPSSLTTGETRAAHVLRSAPVFIDAAAEAAHGVNLHVLGTAIGSDQIKVAVMPATAAPAGESAAAVAADVLQATGHADIVVFAVVGKAFGAAAGPASGLKSEAVNTIVTQASASHQTGGFTSANIEATLEDAVQQTKGALAAAPAVTETSAPGADNVVDTTTSKDPPAGLVIGAAIVVVLVVVVVAVMSILSRRAAREEAEAVVAPVTPEPVTTVAPEPEPEPVVDLTDAAVDPEPTGALPVVGDPVVADAAAPAAASGAAAPPPPAWTGGEWAQAVLTNS